MDALETKVRNWMKKNSHRMNEFIDEMGEYNLTSLGEECSNELNLFVENSPEADEICFELAYEYIEKYDKKYN